MRSTIFCDLRPCGVLRAVRRAPAEGAECARTFKHGFEMMNCSFTIRQCSEVFLGAAAELLPELVGSRRAVVVTDANIDRLYHPLLARYATVLIGSGETVKTLATAEKIFRRFIELGVDRSTLVVGIGGGIVTDIAGFVASTWMRGVPFGFVATTLLGQIDAGIGGKNGVNVDGFKNMVGTFRQPEFVVCDPEMLRTLSDREFRTGLAEAVKAGIIADPVLFGLIERATLTELRSDRQLLSEVILAAIRVKAGIVERDEQEGGERRKLNLGHTLGHAIEKCSNRMNHGEAVAVGTVLIARAAVRMGLLSEDDCRRISSLFETLGFDLTLPVDLKRLLRAVARDKKTAGDMLHVVFPTAIGRCEVRRIPLAAVGELF